MKACYIHVPFCNKICAYCDFMRCVYQKQLADKWLDRICEDIQCQLSNDVETIYIGGGTPSALSYKQLDRLLTSIEPYTDKVKEYTIEANPDSLDEKKIQLLHERGIHRISLGVQTFQGDLQDIIHRYHTVSEIQTIIDVLHKYEIHNISIDLMYGLPSQSMKKWQEDLAIAANLPIQHISLYALTIEEHSQFGRENIQPMEANLEADMYEYAISYLDKQGFQQYEISNFAKAGYESNHNIMYWRYEDFLGIGCGASGKENHNRYDNTKNLHTYITKGAMPHYIPLDKEDEVFETLMMSLRMKQGLYLPDFEKRFGCIFNKTYQIPLKKHLDLNNLVIDQKYLRTTYQGMLLLNDILVDFLR